MDERISHMVSNFRGLSLPEAGTLVGYAALIAAGLFLGAYFGARLVQPVSDLTLRRMFAGFLILVSIRMFWEK